MYERFTDRARKVMQLAQQEAQHWNHEYVGTEHILLGLLKEMSGIAGMVLTNLKLDLGKCRDEVTKLLKRGPEMVTMGKLPFTPRSKKVIEYAINQACALKDDHVGTEHLLLGLAIERDGVASQILSTFGCDLDVIKREIVTVLQTGKGLPERDMVVVSGIMPTVSVHRFTNEHTLFNLIEQAALRLEMYGGALNIALVAELREAVKHEKNAWAMIVTKEEQAEVKS